MHAQPIPTKHFSFHHPPQADTAVDDEALRFASSEAAQREAAFLDCLNRNEWFKALAEPVLREPRKPEHFAENLHELDEQIVARGIKVSRDRLLSLGKRRFAE